METKEEYVNWVREWKITHEALVKLQLHVKKYLIKSTYPQKKYKLTQEEIKKYVRRFQEVFQAKFSWISTENMKNWNQEKSPYWVPDCIKMDLTRYLRDLYEMRASMKEHFKNKIEISTGV